MAQRAGRERLCRKSVALTNLTATEPDSDRPGSCHSVATSVKDSDAAALVPAHAASALRAPIRFRAPARPVEAPLALRRGRITANPPQQQRRRSTTRRGDSD